MHIHTCASDGTWDVYELKEELLKNNIKIFSITDHDSIDNIKNMNEIINLKDDLLFFPGVELTTSYDDKEYHLTLYNFDDKCGDLIDLINETREKRINANTEFIENYIAKKYDSVTKEDYEKYEYDKKRGGWKSANYLIDKGIHKDYLSHLVDVKEAGYKADLKGPEETIKIAKKSGGKIFLAHPSYHFKNSYMPEEELKVWVELGIDGIECYSPYNGKFIDYYLNFCKKNNLMISGGSDCHGNFIESRKIGHSHVELRDLNIKGLL